MHVKYSHDGKPDANKIHKVMTPKEVSYAWIVLKEIWIPYKTCFD